MKVASLFYGTIAGSPYNGALAIHVEFGRNGTDLSSVDLVNKIVNYPQNAAAPAVVLTGDFTVLEKDSPMTDVIKALIDWNFFIFIQSDGTVYPTWFGFIKLGNTPRGYHIVTLDQSPWLRHECDEIRLVFTKKNTPEPALPFKGPNLLYVMPTENSLIEPAIKFIQRSTHPWRLYLPSGGFYSKPISLDDDADEAEH